MTEMPPRVPNGVPGTWRIWFASRETWYKVIPGVASGSPTASRLIRSAARTYAPISAGEIVSASDMLSNPFVVGSGGRSSATSTSRSSSSRTEFRYSVRFTRCNSGALTWGSAAAAASIRASSADANAFRVAASGRGKPTGGIIPERTLRMSLSACAALCSGWARSNSENEKPPSSRASL